MKFTMIAVALLVWGWVAAEVVQYLVYLDHQIEMQDRV